MFEMHLMYIKHHLGSQWMASFKRKDGGQVVYDWGAGVVPGLVVVARELSSLMILPWSNDRICHVNSNLAIEIYALVILGART